MYKPIERINEIRNILNRFRLVETALDAVIIFLVLFIILSYARVGFIWAMFVPPVLFFFVALKYRSDKDIIKYIEERYPGLKERLGALYDSRDEKNIIVADLATSVDAELNRVKYSSFMSIPDLGIRIAVIVILVTSILSFSIIRMLETPSQPEIPGGLNVPDMIRTSGGPDPLGESAAVRIGNDSEGILIYRSQGSEPNIKGEGAKVSGFSMPFPEEGTESGIYQEAVPEEYQLIVKNYFVNLTRV